jgi:conjugative relaxase-like TrwC/TraI family protein
MRMMGAESVAYHRQTVIERSDDHPGLALDYYGSRGETPLEWGGKGAGKLGLTGTVEAAQYDALYGPHGARDPASGTRLVATTRPGMELVIAAHKSVAELGVIGRPGDMHLILDAERDATMGHLDRITQLMGGRRGRERVVVPTEGLIYATARHGTTRAGDPGPHDHVLIANLIWMKDRLGGWKAPDTALWREHLHAATMIGRLEAAWAATELGYAIEADPGPTGKLGHWKIAGIPNEAMALHSKRGAEIDEAVDAKGYATYQARAIAARDTRKYKRHTGVDELVPKWRAELEAIGLPPGEILGAVNGAALARDLPRPRLSQSELDQIAQAVLGPEGALSKRKVFSPRDVIVAVVPSLYGRNPAELTKVVGRVLNHPDAIALLRCEHTSERAYATASVIAAEQVIERRVAAQVVRTDAPAVTPAACERAIEVTKEALGVTLTATQRQAVTAICTSGQGVELVTGVAGAGKTTVMATVAQAFGDAGYEVLGTAVSGQAARTLGREAHMTTRTVASLRWRMDHGRISLTNRHVVVIDEASMADDQDVAAVLEAAGAVGAKVVMVGDDRQLGAIDPGGSQRALSERHGAQVTVLDKNVRQYNALERVALSNLRAGHMAAAVSFYESRQRITIAPTRQEALAAMVESWAEKTLGEDADAMLLAYRRANVAELNRLARAQMETAGRLRGPELTASGGARYRAGDRIVTLAASPDGSVVTSERGVVTAVDKRAGWLTATMDDGRAQQFGAELTGADRLAHGYATTVHRAQGATCDAAYTFSDGGGRELAYVAMSRGRELNCTVVVADDLEQAKDDLVRDWSQERRWHWAIDQGTPVRGERRESVSDLALRRAALDLDRKVVAGLVPTDVTQELDEAHTARAVARQDLENLREGRGRFQGTEVGQMAEERRNTGFARARAEQNAKRRDLPRKDRREYAKQATILGENQRAYDTRFQELAASIEPELVQRVEEAEGRFVSLAEHHDRRERWIAERPQLTGHLADIEGEFSRLDGDLSMRQTITGTMEATGTEGRSPTRSPERDRDLSAVERARQLRRDGPGFER